MTGQVINFIKVANTKCNFSLLLNDIELLQQMEDSSISTYIPINEFLQPDDNRLQISMHPLTGKPALDAQAGMQISLEQAMGHTSAKQQLAKFSSPDFSAYAEEKKELPDIYSWSVQLHVMNEKIKYRLYELEVIQPSQNFIQELVRAYQAIYALFRDKNLSAILQALEIKIEDKASAYHKTKEQIVEEITRDLRNTFGDNENELLEFDVEDFTLKTEYNGRLFSLVDKYNDPVIIYYHEALNISNKYPMRFGRVKGDNRFKIVR